MIYSLVNRQGKPRNDIVYPETDSENRSISVFRHCKHTAGSPGLPKKLVVEQSCFQGMLSVPTYPLGWASALLSVQRALLYCRLLFLSFESHGFTNYQLSLPCFPS